MYDHPQIFKGALVDLTNGERPGVASGHSIAAMRFCGPGSLLGCREGGPGPRAAE